MCPLTLIDTLLGASVTKGGKSGLDFFPPFTMSHSRRRNLKPQRENLVTGRRSGLEGRERTLVRYFLIALLPHRFKFFLARD